MDEIDLVEGVSIALDALFANRLALLCGAGLSMASPSNLPNAAQLATWAQRKYEATYGTNRPALPPSIEEQAKFFFQRGELGTIYLRTFIDPHAFAGPPNAGHTAVADLLLIRGIQPAVSTNVDTMIETAGKFLFGQIGVGLEKAAVAALLPDRSPLLKIHGCWSSDLSNTVWTSEQLAVEPVASRIAGSKEWLSVQLLDRDLLVVGYFTDWDYLNAILERVLGDVNPARVVIVDLGDGASLAAKAPVLYALGERARSRFCHVRESGAIFLERLRMEFSRSFLRRVLYAGKDAYQDLKGTAADLALLEPPSIDTDDLWRIRRDLEGRLPNQPALDRAPPNEPVLGLTILQLRANGATAEGPFWAIGGHRVRVVRTPNQLLHQVETAFAGETPPIVAPDIIIAVGAETAGLAAHIVRSGAASTIARGSAGRWLTRADANTELGI